MGGMLNESNQSVNNRTPAFCNPYSVLVIILKHIELKKGLHMKRRKIQLIAICLFFSLLLSTFSINLHALNYESVSDSTNTSPTDTSTPSTTDIIEKIEEDDTRLATEILSRRERTIKHFNLGNGIYQAVSYGMPVHRRDANGEWIDIDNRLYPTEENARHYATADGRISISQSTPTLILNENGYRIGIQLETGTVELSRIVEIQNHNALPDTLTRNVTDLGPLPNKTVVRYRNIFPSVDIEYILVGDDIKENIIITAPSKSHRYQFTLILDGLIPILIESGEILLCDEKTNEEKYQIPAPYMYDANGNQSTAVHYELAGQNGIYQLQIVANENWINSKDRAFPVTIDPTIKQKITYDTYISSANPDETYGSSTELWVSSSRITFLRLSTLPTLPAGCQFYSANLHTYYYYHNTVTSGNLYVGAYQVNHSWSESTLTWNLAKPSTTEYISSTKLSTANLSGARKAYVDSPKNATFNVTAAARSWYNGTAGHYGIALKYESGQNYSVILKSWEAETQYRAYFSVAYTEPNVVSKVYRIKNVANGLYLTVGNGSRNNGTAVVQAPLTSVDNRQLFKITYVGTYGEDLQFNYYTIRTMLDSRKGLSTGLSDSNRNASIETVSYNDTWADQLYNELWAIIKNGSNYVLKNGALLDASYLSAPSNSTTNAQVFSSTTTSGYSRWVLEEYTGDEIDSIRYSNSTNIMAVGERFSFEAYMYCSKIGVNGPVQYSVVNADGTATDKATVNAFGRVEALKPGVITVRATHTGAKFYWLKTVTIEESLEGTFLIKNRHYEKFIQVDNNDAPNYANNGGIIEQWTYDGGNYQKWTFKYISAGYYKILSAVSDYAITVPSGKEESADVSLILTPYTGSINQHWRITQTSHGFYKIKAKSSMNSSKDLAMRVNTKGFHSEDGLNIMQMPYTDDIDFKDEWWLMTREDSAQRYSGHYVPSSSFTIQCIGSNAQSSAWYPLILQSSEAWNNTTGTVISVSTTEESPYTCEVDAYSAKWYGITNSTYIGKNILSGKICINTATCTNNSIFRKSTITHEIGHLLGLNDNPPVSAPNESLMSHMRDRTKIYIPQPYDITNVKYTYGLR